MVTLRFHLEACSRDEVHWWIDSPQVPTLWVSAIRLTDCRNLAIEMLDAIGVRQENVNCVLVAA